MRPFLAVLRKLLLVTGLGLLGIVGLVLLVVLAVALRPLLFVLLFVGAFAAKVLDHYSPRFHRWFQTV